jgi:hypothetical protein
VKHRTTANDCGLQREVEASFLSLPYLTRLVVWLRLDHR